MTNFNIRFQKTWNRIPDAVRPSADHAFLYYLKNLNSDISVMIQSMGGQSLPQAYSIAIRAENIQAGKIAPRPPMPYFSDIHPNMPLHIPPLATIPVVPAIESAGSQTNAIAGPSNELQEIKTFLQTLGNELTSMKKQQYQGPRPPFQGYNQQQ